MQWKRNFGVVLLSIGLISAGLRESASDPTPSQAVTPQTSFRIQFVGYQVIDKDYVFQIRLLGAPANQQPGLKKTGDPLGFGGYIVGPFHVVFKTGVDPVTHQTIGADASTLELDKPDEGLKITVPFRAQVDLPK